MKRRILSVCFAFFCLLSIGASADEGMWLPSLIGEGRIDVMRSRGFRLTAEDLYSVNQASLKDAIVRFGSGCTGELISDKGLLITNHHCGYSQIQSHSSVENDYLTYGFAAMNPAQELPNPGLVVSFLVEMRDVTPEVLKGVTDKMTDEKKAEKVKNNREKIIKDATKGNHYQARVESLYYGNQYFLFVYEVFEDVRLVFAPPSAIGKFGGDTDNWMWPRHTGDFSLFRVYAGPDNKPAPYSEENVPYIPKKSFTISLKGIQEGDFTFIYGFPGRTYEYLHSEAVRYIQQIGDPEKVKLRTIRLDIMNRSMAADPATRIQYAAKNARVSNAWKKWQGEMKGLARLGTVEKKRQFEKEFEAWAANRPEYAGVTERLAQLYAEQIPYTFARDYHTEAAFAVELITFARNFIDLTPEKLEDPAQREKLINTVNTFFKDYDPAIDKETANALFGTMMVTLKGEEQLPTVWRNLFRTPQYLDELFYPRTILNQEQLVELMNSDPQEASERLSNDLAVRLAKSLVEFDKEKIAPEYLRLDREIEAAYKTYMRGMMEMQADREFYPDANSTLRIAYGKIEGYEPADGIYYEIGTTLEGVMQKDNPDIYDYNVPEKLRQLYRDKDYGQWAVNGTVPVAFIASNHTSGGNSGSPVLNADGHLIGLNFDRCWEGTMSDIEYDPTVCRNISVDIRYALFLIDKVGGAGYLLDEMNFDR